MTEKTRYRTKALVRHANRARWLTKARNTRRYINPHAKPSERLRYILTSPEVGDFSHNLGDLDEAAMFVANVTAAPIGLARDMIMEVLRDERLHHDYAQRRRATLLPAQMQIGQRALWYAIVRITKPQLVVETGVWYGLGSMVLLRALERNKEEGRVGSLISFDPDPTAGWLVPNRFRDLGAWRIIRERTDDALERILRMTGDLDVFIHDTPSGDGSVERMEYEIAAGFAREGAFIVSGNGENTPELLEFSERRGYEYHHTSTRTPDGHWYVSNGMSVAVVA